MTACREKMAEDVGALLGINVQLVPLENRISRGEDFNYKEGSDGQVLANLDVVGEIEQRSFLSITLKDAKLLGGRLLFLSDSELRAVIGNDNFNPDMEDAYGEIVNIISGVFTAVFEKECTGKIRFIKTGIQKVPSMKMESFFNGPAKDKEYHVSSMRLILGKNAFGMIHILFPVDLLQLDNFVMTVADVIEKPSTQQPIAEQSVAETEGKIKENIKDVVAVGNTDNSVNHADILLIGDDEVEVGKLSNVLGRRGYGVRVLSFKDNVYDFITGDLKAVYLVTRKIDEQALGVAIKVSSACSLPIIAAAPGWTKLKVIKAVKYGVKDILLTPAEMEDIEENIANNLNKLAA